MTLEERSFHSGSKASSTVAAKEKLAGELLLEEETFAIKVILFMKGNTFHI